MRLLSETGQACLDYHDEVMKDLPRTKVRCDEIRSFVYSKAENVAEDKQGEFGYGDVWTWVSICADTTLVPDGLITHLASVGCAIGNDTGCAMLVIPGKQDGGRCS